MLQVQHKSRRKPVHIRAKARRRKSKRVIRPKKNLSEMVRVGLSKENKSLHQETIMGTSFKMTKSEYQINREDELRPWLKITMPMSYKHEYRLKKTRVWRYYPNRWNKGIVLDLSLQYNNHMKLSGNRLKLSSGKVVHFKSSQARNNFERVAKAVKYGGFKPKRK